MPAPVHVTGKAALLGALLFAAASAASAQSLAIIIPPGAPPTADQAKDCIAAHWIGARNAPSPVSPIAIAERQAAAAWIGWLTSTTGRTQLQLQPEVKLATDRISFTDPTIPDLRAPILTSCAAYERVSAPAPVINLAESASDHDQSGEEGGLPDDGSGGDDPDDAGASADDFTPPT